MLKKYHQFLVAMFVMVDMIITNLCFVLAYYLRFNTNLFDFIHTAGDIPAYSYLSPVAFFFISFIWIIVFKFSGLYQPRRGKSILEEVFTILNAITLSTFILVVFMFFQRDIEYSRLVIGLFWLLNFLFLATTRTLIRLILREMRKRKYNLRHVVIVGSGKSAESIIKSLIKHSYYGLRVRGIVDDDESIQNKAIYGVPVLGKIENIIDILKKKGIDQVFIALPNSQFHKINDIIKRLKTEIVDIKLIPDVLELILLRSSVESLDGIPIIDISHTPLTGWNSLIKRIFDVFSSMIGLMVFAPLMVLIAILVKLTSRGPVFFKQERTGLDGKTFTMYKFRTMRIDPEKKGGNNSWTVKDDPRRTRFGIFLRRSGLDELPQLINVLSGEMSIVGPRPELPGFVDQFKGQIPEYMLRHKVKSGITGWAQVNGWRGDTSIIKRIECDIFYIENWSFKFDLEIIYKTILTGSFHKNAY